ncbi:DUF7782 domain-containing protein [Saccharopolyspora sp. NPDC002376]
MIPDLSHDRIDRLRDAFRAAEYDADGVVELLGPEAHISLGRGELVPALRATADAGPLGTLIRLFLLGQAEPQAAVEAAFAPLPLAEAQAAGIVVADGDRMRAGLDIRPHGVGDDSWWVMSDLDSELRGGRPVEPDHVLGVGHASLSLVRATSRREVGSVLDLGTGCGVQALHASKHAQRITATDVSKRALALADATFRINELDVELVEGEWFEPVRGRRFDMVVCNPPFVVGPPRTDFTYRDSGLAGDDASALVVRQLPSFLNEGGTGQLLASWVHREGEDWEDRVSRWLPPGAGVDAWFVQRDVADPALYVGTWLRDAGYDLRSQQGQQKAGEWLDWFENNGVLGIGFGFVTLRRTDAARGEVVCEDLRHAFEDPLGPESDQWLRRVDWLRVHGSNDGLLAARLVTADSTVLEQVSAPGDEGWSPLVHRLHRTDGPGWQHEVDELGVRLLAGCRGALPLEELIELLAMGFGEDSEELTRAALPVVRELIRHGMLVPAEWTGGAQ